MRVGIIALLHESNTFISEPTGFDKFEQDVLEVGEAVRERMGATHHEVAGFFAGLEEAGIDAVPIFAARAMPFGTIPAQTYDRLMQQMFDELAKSPKVDGYLIAPHGATVSEVHRDADGHWLERLREEVGPDVPIVCTIDPHANLSVRMVESCDATIAYRTNPHLDQKERGIEAARLMARTLRGEVRPTQAAVFPPIAISIESQHTSAPPCKPLYDRANEMLKTPGVLSNSIVLGFPYADVPEMGSSVIVVTDNDPELASSQAADLAGELWQRRDTFLGEFIDIDTALRRLQDLDGPVGLLDMGDNVGGGSPADSTLLLHAIEAQGVPDAFVCLFDPEAVREAKSAGVGSTVRLTVGGKTDKLHGEPLTDDFSVAGLYDGRFHEPRPRHGGFTHANQGDTAVVKSSRGTTILLNSQRMPPFSLHQLISCDLDPASFRALVAKGVNLPLASYGEVCKHFIRVNTAGVTTADMRLLEFHTRRRPMLPFEQVPDWQP